MLIEDLSISDRKSINCIHVFTIINQIVLYIYDVVNTFKKITYITAMGNLQK